MKTPSLLPRLFCLALALAWTHGAQASTVFWGSNFNDNLYDSSGNALDSTYSFEIGSFGTFVPTYQNIDQWQANWHVIDRAFDPDSNGWNSTEQFFVGTVGFNTDGTSDSPDANPADVFTQGDVVYLWVYNSLSIVPGSEWALVTDGSPVGDSADDWIIPDPADTSSSFNWQLTDANSAVIGGANGVQGPGGYSTTPSVFSLQTAVVPEPGSALLLLAAAAAHLTRRARRLSRMPLL
ncbi:PEP-CTERM sorting domain-containing protein [Prosthecobacter sp.]|uniref:PEP-CTERM sorting domain-containing protein n=1 Tax=Prosthecobacter sp. TaxID=1965333 RepID=UPI0037830D3E